MRMQIGIGSGVVIFFIASFFCLNIIPDFVIALGVATVITVILYFLWVFPYCSCIVPADKAWIFANTLEHESSDVQSKFSGFRTISAQIEFQAGFHWVYFWEKASKEVDMSRSIQVQNDPEEPFTLKSGKTVNVTYRVFCVPLPGNVVNYTRTKPEDILRRVKDRADSFLQGYIGGLDVVKFDKDQMDKIKIAFEGLYGGKDTIDPEERELGIWTGTPEIIDIDQPKSVQAAANFEQEMVTKIGIANKMVAASGGNLKYEQAMKLVLIGDGKAKLDFVEIAGSIFPVPQPKQQGKKGNTP